MANKPEMIFWLSDRRGVYIPKDFAESFIDRAKSVTGVSDEEWAILEAGPDHEQYWDAWCDVEANALVTDTNGAQYRVHQDGDCWLVPVGMEWSDGADTFIWPDDDDEVIEPEDQTQGDILGLDDERSEP